MTFSPLYRFGGTDRRHVLDQFGDQAAGIFATMPSPAPGTPGTGRDEACPQAPSAILPPGRASHNPVVLSDKDDNGGRMIVTDMLDQSEPAPVVRRRPSSLGGERIHFGFDPAVLKRATERASVGNDELAEIVRQLAHSYGDKDPETGAYTWMPQTSDATNLFESFGGLDASGAGGESRPYSMNRERVMQPAIDRALMELGSDYWNGSDSDTTQRPEAEWVNDHGGRENAPRARHIKRSEDKRIKDPGRHALNVVMQTLITAYANGLISPTPRPPDVTDHDVDTENGDV